MQIVLILIYHSDVVTESGVVAISRAIVTEATGLEPSTVPYRVDRRPIPTLTLHPFPEEYKERQPVRIGDRTMLSNSRYGGK